MPSTATPVDPHKHGKNHALRIGAGAVVHCIDGTVCMPQFLNVVGTRCLTGDGDLAAGISGMRPRNQRGTGRIRIDSELPAGEILPVLCSFRQADIAHLGDGL